MEWDLRWRKLSDSITVSFFGEAAHKITSLQSLGQPFREGGGQSVWEDRSNRCKRIESVCVISPRSPMNRNRGETIMHLVTPHYRPFQLYVFYSDGWPRRWSKKTHKIFRDLNTVRSQINFPHSQEFIHKWIRNGGSLKSKEKGSKKEKIIRIG